MPILITWGRTQVTRFHCRHCAGSCHLSVSWGWLSCVCLAAVSWLGLNHWWEAVLCQEAWCLLTFNHEQIQVRKGRVAKDVCRPEELIRSPDIPGTHELLSLLTDTIAPPCRLCLTWNTNLEPRSFFCPNQFFLPTHFSWSSILHRQVWKLRETIKLSKWFLIVFGEASKSCACSVGSYTVCLWLPLQSHPLIHVHLSPVPKLLRPFLCCRIRQSCFTHLDLPGATTLPHRVVGRLWGFYGVKSKWGKRSKCHQMMLIKYYFWSLPSILSVWNSQYLLE